MKDMWNQLPDEKIIQKTIFAFKENGISAFFVETIEDAKRKILDIIPRGAEIMNMTSVTLDTMSLSKEILESGKYQPIRSKLEKMDQKTQGNEMQKLGAAPEWVIGSVHAVTQDGHVLIASNTGSQLPAYAYGASHVIWVVGAQKIVKDTHEGMKRVYEHSLLLESERAKKAYGVSGSAVNKLLIINHEVKPERIIIILVNEVLGF